MERFKPRQYYQPDFPPENKMGFAVPATPGHSLRLLNHYMRTDLLRSIHERIQRKMENKEPGSPLKKLADSLADVIETYETVNLFECVQRNPHHVDPGYEFSAEKDYLHDIELMKHHLRAHVITLKEIEDF